MAAMAGLAVGFVLYMVDLQMGRRSAEMRRENGLRAGRGRVDEILPTGVYPTSAESAPASAEAQGMASWGQGERGAAGYEDSGGSELPGPQER